MRTIMYVTVAMLAGGSFMGGRAEAANLCKAERLSCATTMPVGGYCECTARGVTEDGDRCEPGCGGEEGGLDGWRLWGSA